MLGLFHVFLTCTPWAAGTARPPLQLEHTALQPTPAVEGLRLELRRLCQESNRRPAVFREARQFEPKLEQALNHSGFEAFPILAEACNCSQEKVLVEMAKRPLSIALKMYPNETMPLLDKLLSDNSVSVRRFASRSLATGIPKYDRWAFDLLKRMLSDTDTGIREEVAKGLVQAINDIGREALLLIEKAQLDTDELVRESCARTIALAMRKFGRGALRLMRRATFDNFEGVRRIVAQSPLGEAVDQFGEDTAFELLKLLLGDASGDVRKAAATTLASKIRNKSKAGIKIWQDAINISCEDDAAWWEHPESCGRMAATAAGKPLVAALETLGHDAFPFLSLALGREEPSVRKMAAGEPLFLTIKPLKLEDARALTLPMMNDSDEEVRASAGQAAAWVEKLEVQRQASVIKDLMEKAEREAKAARAAAANATMTARDNWRLAAKANRAQAAAKRKSQIAKAEAHKAKEAEATAVEEARKASKAEAKAVEEARKAHEAEANAKEQAQKAREAEANATEQANFAKKQKEVAYASLQEAEIAKIQAEASIGARRKTQEDLDMKKEKLEESSLELLRQKIELEEKDKLAQEQKETMQEYKNVAMGALAAALVAIVPLVADRLGTKSRADPSPQSSGERAD